MKISTKGRYALRMLLDLAQTQQDGYVALKEIAARQNISKKYLEQIVIALNPTGILTSNRGFQGGYRLARAPRNISVLEVLEATEDSMAPVTCLRSEVNTCPRQSQCSTLSLWTGLYDTVKSYLGNITLQQLLDESAALTGNDYII